MTLSPTTQRIKLLLEQLQHHVYEKETEMALALLAALAGESILLLGPPGVAKSMVARKLKEAFREARSFEYLMSRFSTPDELFGPVSIAQLKHADRYERMTEGYLPTADVVFLDEIWKAGPAIQNTLLTVINEKLFRNGEKEMKLPLKLLVAASNELPAKGEGLEALWDRFLIRVVSHCIEKEETFRQMLTDDHRTLAANEETYALDPELTITEEEYTYWQTEARKVVLSEGLLQAITTMRKQLEHVELEGSDLPRRVYISDRRWKHIAQLIRTAAFLQERKQAGETDLFPMYHCLWNEPEEIEAVRRITLRCVFQPIERQLEKISLAVKADLRACRAQEALAKALRDNDHRDDDLEIVDRFFYQIDNHGTGHTCIFITDFKRLPQRTATLRGNSPLPGILYTDPQQPRRRVIRLFTPELNALLKQQEAEQVTLCRDDEHIYINGVKFRMHRQGTTRLNPAEGSLGALFDTPAVEQTPHPFSSNHYEEDIETACTQLEATQHELEDNLFVSQADLNLIRTYVQTLSKQIALTRADLRKLLYNEA